MAGIFAQCRNSVLLVGALLLIGLTLGCGHTSAKSKQEVPNLELHKIDVNGTERTYFLYVPHSYNGQPVPLVLHFHGGGGSGDFDAAVSGWPELAESARFIVAFPNGTKSGSNEGGTWNTGGEKGGYAEVHDVDDLGFVKALLVELKSRYAIDPRRIYATGFSKGAVFVYYAACNMSDVFAAIAPVSGTLNNPDCNLKEPVSLLHIHGTDDDNVPFKGGKGRFTAGHNEWRPVMDGIEYWRSRDKCESDKKEVMHGEDTTCWHYPGCTDNEDVSYCLVQGGGHAWPGIKPLRWQKLFGVHVSQSFHATSEIWKFFAAHPKPH